MKSTGKESLISFLSNLTVEERLSFSWLNLANRFEIKPNGTDSQKRKAANDIWRNFKKSQGHKAPSIEEFNAVNYHQVERDYSLSDCTYTITKASTEVLTKEKNGVYIIMGCVHVPFFNLNFMKAAIKCISTLNVKGIIFNGDFLDLATLSFHDKGKNAVEGVTLGKEYESGNKVLDSIESVIPKSASKVFLYGNHEDRFNRHMSTVDYGKLKGAIKSPIEGLNLNTRGYKIYTDWINDEVNLGDLTIIHGEFCTTFAAKKHLDVYRKNMLFAHCFSEDTEVLTESGWKLFPELDINKDKVATIKLDGSHEFEWNDIESFHEYDHYKELIHFYSHGMDLLVTDEHSMVKWFKATDRLARVEAKELVGKTWHTLNGTVNTNKDYDISDDLLKLLGWVITDGNFQKDKNGNPQYIRLKQCNKPKVGLKHITDILDSLGQSYKVGKLTNSINYECADVWLHKSKLTDIIINLIPNKGLQDWMLGLSKRQFDLLLHEIILADGCYNKDALNSMQYVTAKDSDRDIMQALCIKNGYRSSATFRNNSYWTITINTRRISGMHKELSKRVPYEGNVYCVSVKNQTLLVRRNGRTSICGNTHRVSMYREGEHVAFNIGSMADFNSPAFGYATKSMKKQWTNGFAIATVVDGVTSVEQIIWNKDHFVYGGNIWKV